jgi:hypothetical protein
MMSEEQAALHAKLLPNGGWDERVHVFRVRRSIPLRSSPGAT